MEVLFHHRYGCLIQRVADHVVCDLARHPKLRLEDDPMTEHRDRITLDVVGRDELAVLDRGVGARDLQERQ